MQQPLTLCRWDTSDRTLKGDRLGITTKVKTHMSCWAWKLHSNPNTQKAEARGMWIPGQAGLQSETPCHNNNKEAKLGH